MNKYLEVTVIALITLNALSTIFLWEQTYLNGRNDQNNVALLWQENSRLGGQIGSINDALSHQPNKNCHIDRVFNDPTDIPEDYAGRVVIGYDWNLGLHYGLGIICT